MIRDGLTWAKAKYDSINGTIASAWKREAGRLTMEVTVPANTSATVSIPAKDMADITEGGKPVQQVKDVKFARQENDKLVFEIGSGSYKFVSEVKPGGN